MDEQGIDVEVLTINAYWYAADRDLASRLIPAQNEALARLGAARPDRFVPLATVALQHPDLAADQLQYAFEKLGMRGAGIGATVNGEELASPRFDPFWAKAEALGAMIFMHPSGVPELAATAPWERLPDQRDRQPARDDHRAVAPDLRRDARPIPQAQAVRRPRRRVPAGVHRPLRSGLRDVSGQLHQQERQKKPSEYLKQLYFDSMVFSGEGLRHLAAECGVGQIFMGTDYPFPWTTTSVDHIITAPGFSDADRIAMLGGNAARLLGIPAA